MTRVPARSCADAFAPATTDANLAYQWPFGENVLVHAIAKTGENYTVAVETAPGAYHKHAKESGSNERVFVKEAALTA